MASHVQTIAPAALAEAILLNPEGKGGKYGSGLAVVWRNASRKWARRRVGSGGDLAEA